tara:strand:+ start:3586 stop:3792 length:207 start_codon:yes stop_codon:yes gene_type:complete
MIFSIYQDLGEPIYYSAGMILAELRIFNLKDCEPEVTKVKYSSNLFLNFQPKLIARYICRVIIRKKCF